MTEESRKHWGKAVWKELAAPDGYQKVAVFIVGGDDTVDVDLKTKREVCCSIVARLDAMKVC